MENIGIRNLKAAELHKNNLLALEIVQIIEAEANFFVGFCNVLLFVQFSLNLFLL